jgi:hypothetical protein
MIKRAELFLNGCLVGRIRVTRLMGAWGFGEFTPTVAFAAFRSVYDEWSRLMHSDGNAPLNNFTALALSRIENAMDRIHGQLLLEDGSWRRIAQVNIDGQLIEWEEREVLGAMERRMAGSHGGLAAASARPGMELAN